MQVQAPIDAIVFDAGETLLHLDLAAIVDACATPEIDQTAVTRALVATRRDLDAFFLPQLAAKRYPSQAQMPTAAACTWLRPRMAGVFARGRRPRRLRRRGPGCSLGVAYGHAVARPHRESTSPSSASQGLE